MTELERALIELGAEIDWPQAPAFERAALARRGRRRLPRLVVVLALVAIAIGVAFAVPQARSALLRIFHLGGVTVQRVGTLPPVAERPLDAGLGRRVSRVEARRTLGGPVRLPTAPARTQLYQLGGIVSAIVAAPEPVLVSEFRSPLGSPIMKKAVGESTRVEPAQVVAAGDGLWIEGARHLFVFPPAAPRMAGNVLLWVNAGLTFRLEGRALTKALALRLAREMTR